MITANAAVGKPWASAAGVILGGLTAGMAGVLGLLDVTGMANVFPGLGDQSRFAVDAGIVVSAAAAAGFVFKPIRKDLAMFLPIDPDSPVHTLALVLVTLWLGMQVTSLAFTDVLAANKAAPPLTIADIFLNEVPFLVLALAGVGLAVRRNPQEAGQRLGIVQPAWWHIALALACAGAFYALAQGSGLVSHALTPGLAQRVDDVDNHLVSQLLNPAGIAALAILPGICEELLFRGALQPRIGLVATALLFTSIHTQYGLSVDTLTLFVLALGLGLIRKYVNTTASSTCHITYNLLVGIGIAGAATTVAVVVEVLLVAVTAYAIWANRPRQAPVNP